MFLPHLQHAARIAPPTGPLSPTPGLANRSIPPRDVKRAGIMYWINFRDVYVDGLRMRYRSDYPDQVARILDRFTRVCRLESARLADIDELTVETYLSSRRRDTWRGRPLSARTLNNEIATLNSAFAYAGPRTLTGSGRRNLNLISSPPWLEPLPELQTEPRVVTVDQLSAALLACNAATTPHVSGIDPPGFWRAALLLDLVTLLRRRALLRIPRPDDRTLCERLEVVLPAELNKTGRTIRLSLGSPEVAALLAKLPTRPGEPLLPWFRETKSGRRPLSLSYFSHRLAELQRAAGISETDRVRLKDLRSTGGTLVADLFGDAVAKKQLGHAPNTDTIQRHYKNYRPTDANQRASATLAGLILPQLAAAEARPALRVHSPDTA